MNNINEYDNQVKLEKWYDGRKLRRYIQLLELSEQICRSSSTNETAKKVAKGFADHYRRMVMLIVMRPFNPKEIPTDNEQDKVFFKRGCEIEFPVWSKFQGLMGDT